MTFPKLSHYSTFQQFHFTNSFTEVVVFAVEKQTQEPRCEGNMQGKRHNCCNVTARVSRPVVAASVVSQHQFVYKKKQNESHAHRLRLVFTAFQSTG